MRVNNFNDPVSLPDGTLTTLEELGGDDLTPATSETLGGVKIGSGVNVDEDGTISVNPGGMTVETFQSNVCPKTLEHDGIVICVNHESGTNADVSITIPNERTATFVMNGNISQAIPVKNGSVVSISNDGGRRNTFFYYH